MVEKKPEEVEQSHKEKMDRIMKRNTEVQNETRALEEQIAELQFAQTDNFHLSRLAPLHTNSNSQATKLPIPQAVSSMPPPNR